MTDGHLVVPDFFDAADALRAAFDAHFADPQTHAAAHQVWNYWYVPDAYAYLKTSPAKVLPPDLVQRFVDRLNRWAVAALGLSTRSHPWLSLYVDGCGQAIHNDATAGQMGYVYSLTRWDRRTFLGGETLLFHPDAYWQTPRMKASGAGTSFYAKVPSHFNQLLVFDDRIVHGVQRVDGTMDPVQGRVVLHGHLSADLIAVAGPVPPEAAVAAAGPALDRLARLAADAADGVHGFVTARLSVGPDGRVADVRPLLDRLLPLSPDVGRVDRFRQAVRAELSSVTFPPAAGPSEVTVPVVVR